MKTPYYSISKRTVTLPVDNSLFFHSISRKIVIFFEGTLFQLISRMYVILFEDIKLHHSIPIRTVTFVENIFLFFYSTSRRTVTPFWGHFTSLLNFQKNCNPFRVIFFAFSLNFQKKTVILLENAYFST